MSLQATSVKTRDALGVTYASPAKPDFTVRYKTSSSVKTLSGKALTNFLSEVIYNDQNPVTVGTDSVNDPVSIRVRISGSLESRARISELLADIAAKLVAWDGEDVFIGFEPTTPPGLTV